MVSCITNIQQSDLTSSPKVTVTPTTHLLARSPTDVREATQTLELETPFTPSPFFTLTPTQTLLPTLTYKDASGLVFDLLNGDPACLFPCFWGFVPGETPTSYVKTFLGQFSSIGYLNFSDTAGFVHIRVPYQSGILLGIIVGFVGNNGKLHEMSVDIVLEKNQPSTEFIFNKSLLSDAVSLYSLPQILATYGLPADVRIFTYSAVLQGTTDEFKLLLMYPEQGFMAEYAAPAGVYLQSGKPNQMIGCFADAYVKFWFWEPSIETTIDDVISQMDGKYFSSTLNKYRRIGDVTDMSLETFYTIFSMADGRQCLMTPQDYWSLP